MTEYNVKQEQVDQKAQAAQKLGEFLRKIIGIDPEIGRRIRILLTKRR